MQTQKFIDQLTKQTEQIIPKVKELETLDLQILTWKENKDSWSILECIEHLNRYGNFYLPQIENEIRRSETKSSEEFRCGILGSYLAKSILPSNKSGKMKTAKSKNPLNAKLDKTIISEFINQQHQFINLLRESQQVDLNKIRIKTSISPLLKLKLGDTFQFIVNHMLRHLNQIDRIQTVLRG